MSRSQFNSQKTKFGRRPMDNVHPKSLKNPLEKKPLHGFNTTTVWERLQLGGLRLSLEAAQKCVPVLGQRATGWRLISPRSRHRDAHAFRCSGSMIGRVHPIRNSGLKRLGLSSHFKTVRCKAAATNKAAEAGISRTFYTNVRSIRLTAGVQVRPRASAQKL